MVRYGAAIMAACCLAACGGSPATGSDGPAAGKVSLQTAPYTGEAAPGAPVLPPAAPVPAATDPTQDISLAAVASQFDPARQHFVWVLPPGVHGVGPWDFDAVVKISGEPKFETTLPLKAELAPAGTRPEYPAGYEIVRLTDDGRWAERTMEIDKAIQDLVAQYGRGLGELEMISQLQVSVDPAYRAQHCSPGARPDVRVYLEEAGQDLISLNHPSITAMIAEVVRKACG